jgi:hypothetical protein
MVVVGVEALEESETRWEILCRQLGRPQESSVLDVVEYVETVTRDYIRSVERTLKAEHERDELRALFDAAGQGEHNVLALVEHWQREALEARRERDEARLSFAVAGERVAALEHRNARLREALKNALLWVANIEEREKARAALKESES